MCYSQIDYYYPGHLSISGGCTDLASCLYQEQRNGVTCFNDTGTGTTCYFCNPDRLSNAQDETSKYNTEIVLSLNFSPYKLSESFLISLS